MNSTGPLQQAIVKCGGTLQCGPKLWCYLITNQTQEATIRKPVEYEAFVTLIQALECWNNNLLAWCGGTPHRGRNIWKTLLCSDEPDFAQPAFSATGNSFRHVRVFLLCNHCQGSCIIDRHPLETSWCKRVCSSSCHLILSRVALLEELTIICLVENYQLPHVLRSQSGDT